MQRLILRLSAALLTFVLGVTVSAIYYISGVRHISVAPAVLKKELPLEPVETSCYPGRSIEAPSVAGASYFPSNVLSHNESGNQFVSEWFSKHLRAMNEAPMYYAEDRWSESYRFLWLRSFHHPVAVRIWKCGSERFIAAKELSGAGGYEPGKLIRNYSRRLTAAEWSEFMRHLEDSCYWNLPTRDENLGLDGALWIFEGVKGGRYHIVDRWSPTSGSYHELCLYVLKLSELKIDDTY